MSAKTYDRQSGSFLAAIGQNMPDISGDEMQEWIGNPKALQEVLRKVFCPPPPDAPTYRKFPVWETVTVQDRVVELVKVTVADLGFSQSRNLESVSGVKAIYSRAKEFGLEQVDFISRDLIRENISVSFEKTIHLATEIECDREGELVVRGFYRDASGALCSSQIGIEGQHGQDSTWVFARSKEEAFLQAEDIACYVTLATLRNATTIVAHVVKVGDEYFEVRSVAVNFYNTMKPTAVKKIEPHKVSLCPAIAQAIEEARKTTENK